MATKVNATTEINTMKTATYGKDMRQAIVDVTEAGTGISSGIFFSIYGMGS